MLTYVESGMSKVTLCSHECISQLRSVISWYLLKMATNEETSSKSSWDKPNKSHMQKGDIISSVGKNCPRDIPDWGLGTWLQSRSCEFKPMHSRIPFIEICYKTAIFSYLPIWLTLEYYECRCCNQNQSQEPERAKIHISKLTLHTQIHMCVNENVLLHLVIPRCIFTRVQIYSGVIRVHMRTFTYMCKIYIRM